MSDAAPLQNAAGKAQSASKAAQAGLMLQRKCACGAPASASLSGECKSCGQKRLQRKLSIGASNDPLEQEADRVADQVMAMSPKDGVSSAPLRIQRATGLATADAGTAPVSVDRVLASPGRALDSGLQQDMGQRFGHDFSQVRIHTDAAAEQSARDVNAHAYTVANDIVFGAGRFAPRSHEGRKLIAHELTHVVQQHPGSMSGGVSPSNNTARKSIQRRRIPVGSDLNKALPPASNTVGVMRARTGLARAMSRAWASLSPAKQTAVRKAVGAFGIHWTGGSEQLRVRLNSASRKQLLKFADEIRKVAPSEVLGNPLLINIGARPGTHDAAHINTLVNNANNIFAKIASGARDHDIIQVFGAADVAKVKANYALAKTRMNALKALNKIVTDRSGYGEEVYLGGLSSFKQIEVDASTIDHPGAKESIVTIIHESMHAGTKGTIGDKGYIDEPSFTKMSTAKKLINAADYEVVPRRILGASYSFKGVTFVPAGTKVGGTTTPTLTPREKAIRDAKETFRKAWTIGLNLHSIYLHVYRNPTEWNTVNVSTRFKGAPPGVHFADSLPFWSKVEMMTIHTRAVAHSIKPAGPPAARPVTLIDMALSEGVTRKMIQGIYGVPNTPAAAQTFEKAHATNAERNAAAASTHVEQKLLIKLVIKNRLGSITGSLGRDERVVARLAKADALGYSDIFTKRSPSSFP